MPVVIVLALLLTLPMWQSSLWFGKYFPNDIDRNFLFLHTFGKKILKLSFANHYLLLLASLAYMHLILCNPNAFSSLLSFVTSRKHVMA